MKKMPERPSNCIQTIGEAGLQTYALALEDFGQAALDRIAELEAGMASVEANDQTPEYSYDKKSRLPGIRCAASWDAIAHPKEFQVTPRRARECQESTHEA